MVPRPEIFQTWLPPTPRPLSRHSKCLIPGISPEVHRPISKSRTPPGTCCFLTTKALAAVGIDVRRRGFGTHCEDSFPSRRVGLLALCEQQQPQGTRVDILAGGAWLASRHSPDPEKLCPSSHEGVNEWHSSPGRSHFAVVDKFAILAGGMQLYP